MGNDVRFEWSSGSVRDVRCKNKAWTDALAVQSIPQRYFKVAYRNLSAAADRMRLGSWSEGVTCPQSCPAVDCAYQSAGSPVTWEHPQDLTGSPTGRDDDRVFDDQSRVPVPPGRAECGLVRQRATRARADDEARHASSAGIKVASSSRLLSAGAPANAITFHFLPGRESLSLAKFLTVPLDPPEPRRLPLFFDEVSIDQHEKGLRAGRVGHNLKAVLDVVVRLIVSWSTCGTACFCTNTYSS